MTTAPTQARARVRWQPGPATADRGKDLSKAASSLDPRRPTWGGLRRHEVRPLGSRPRTRFQSTPSSPTAVLDHCNPIPSAKVEQVLDMLDLPDSGMPRTSGRQGGAEIRVDRAIRSTRERSGQNIRQMIKEAEADASARGGPGVIARTSRDG